MLPGRPSTELDGAPAHCSYRRSALLAVGGFPEDLRAGEDTVVNQALVRRGYHAYRAQDVLRPPARAVRPETGLASLYPRTWLGRILRDRDGMTRRDLIRARGRRLLRQQTVGRMKATSAAGPRLGGSTPGSSVLGRLPAGGTGVSRLDRGNLVRIGVWCGIHDESPVNRWTIFSTIRLDEEPVGI